MKKYIYFFLLISIFPAFSQDVLKDIKWEEVDNSIIYERLKINDNRSLIISISHIDESGVAIKYIVFNKFLILKHQLKTDLNSHEIDTLKTIEIDLGKGHKYFEMLDTMASKKYLSTIKQGDLDLKVYDNSDASDDEKLQISFYQAKRYYTLYLENPKRKGKREREKLDLFLEFFKLIEDTWNITNTPKGRPVKE